jgi:hypothetical protein
MSGVENHLRNAALNERCFPDGTLVELLYRPEEERTLFAVHNAGRWTLQDHIELSEKTRLIPFSPNNNLIKNEVVLLPSEPCIYGTEKELVLEVGDFIHKYADLSATFEQVACHYVLLTWLLRRIQRPRLPSAPR